MIYALYVETVYCRSLSLFLFLFVCSVQYLSGAIYLITVVSWFYQHEAVPNIQKHQRHTKDNTTRRTPLLTEFESCLCAAQKQNQYANAPSQQTVRQAAPKRGELNALLSIREITRGRFHWLKQARGPPTVQLHKISPFLEGVGHWQNHNIFSCVGI